MTDHLPQGVALLALVQGKALRLALERAGLVDAPAWRAALLTAAAEVVTDPDVRTEVCFALDDTARLH